MIVRFSSLSVQAFQVASLSHGLEQRVEQGSNEKHKETTGVLLRLSSCLGLRSPSLSSLFFSLFFSLSSAWRRCQDGIGRECRERTRPRPQSGRGVARLVSAKTRRSSWATTLRWEIAPCSSKAEILWRLSPSIWCRLHSCSARGCSVVDLAELHWRTHLPLPLRSAAEPMGSKKITNAPHWILPMP